MRALIFLSLLLSNPTWAAETAPALNEAATQMEALCKRLHEQLDGLDKTGNIALERVRVDQKHTPAGAQPWITGRLRSCLDDGRGYLLIAGLQDFGQGDLATRAARAKGAGVTLVITATLTPDGTRYRFESSLLQTEGATLVAGPEANFSRAALRAALHDPTRQALMRGMIPGWGHLTVGERAWGWTWIVAEIALLATATTYYIQGNRAQRAYHQNQPETVRGRGDANRLYGYGHWAAAGAGAVWLGQWLHLYGQLRPTQPASRLEIQGVGLSWSGQW